MTSPTSSVHPVMPTAALGRSGLVVSRFALGTMTFGVETDPVDAMAQLDRFHDVGGTLVDTADVYGGGESERIVGRWLADRRHDDVIVATKGRFAPPPGSAGGSRRAIVRSVDASLERLGIGAIDLYFMHGWDQNTPVDETLDTLSTLVRAGKLHSIAWSNVTGWQLAEILATARTSRHIEPCALQPQYNLLDRTIEIELLPCCIDHRISTTPWSPLGGGWLTGKYRHDRRPDGPTRLGDDPNRGVEAYDLRNTDHTWSVLDTVADIADGHGRPMAHVALAWLLTRPTVSTVLLGARTLEQLDKNLAAIDLELTDDDLTRLNEVSAPQLPSYPYRMIEKFCDVPHWRDLGLTT